MEAFWHDFPAVAADLETVKQRLWEAFRQAPEPLKSDLQPLFDRGGKALRPAFVLLAARAGQMTDTVYNLAAAAELLHLATLIHDDVVDGASLRRGEPAFPVRVGVPKAVLYGDLLFSVCFHLVTSQVSRESALALSKIVSLMAGAEIIQHDDLFQPNPSLRRALKKIMGKTAALISLCLYTGAVESGQPPAVCQTWRRLGYNVGMAFQIIDDILDFTATQDRLGKPVLWDLSHGVFSVPVVLALRQAPAETNLAPRLQALKTSTNPADLAAVVQSIHDQKGLEQARQLASTYTARAQKLLTTLPDTPARRDLARLITRLLDRTY